MVLGIYFAPSFFIVHPYSYLSTRVFTCSNDWWMGLCIKLHTQTYIYVKIAKRTVMALLQQPTEERMVSTFLKAYVCGINIVSRNRYA